MLHPEYLINRIEHITLMYNDLHTSILEMLARHISDAVKATGEARLIPSAAYRAERLSYILPMGDIIKRIAEINHMSRKEIRGLFEDAAIEARIYDDRIYKAAGLEPIPVMQSPEMLRTLEAGVSKTLGSVERLTGTIATNTQDQFERILNLAYNKVVSGAFSYHEAIARAVDDLSRKGVDVFHYESGRAISIEAAVRMNVLTGANQTAAKITEDTAAELGVSLFRVSAHQGARNKGDVPENHEKFQGRIFHWREHEPKMTGRIIRFTGKYDDFILTTGYMVTAKGLAGPNCRHSFGPYIEGLSPETYSRAELDKFASETVTYTDPDGEKKTVSYYDGTQKQRELERKVRHWKKRQKCKEAAGLDASIEKSKVRKWQMMAKKFTEETGLRRDYNRERIAE